MSQSVRALWQMSVTLPSLETATRFGLGFFSIENTVGSRWNYSKAITYWAVVKDFCLQCWRPSLTFVFLFQWHLYFCCVLNLLRLWDFLVTLKQIRLPVHFFFISFFCQMHFCIILKHRLATTVLVAPSSTQWALYRLCVSVVSIEGGERMSQLCRGLFKAVRITQNNV